VTTPPPEIEALVRGYTRGDVSDDAMERWLRAVYDRGISLDETFALTMAMATSGETIDWSGVRGPIVDKHSTGGVGDAVTLIAVPVAAACGVTVAKLSGRALGHTGGTIDKLECVPGLRTELSVAEFKAVVERAGCAVAAATADLAPADKKMYALRHRTGLIASIPLIAASVMSKKIAAGADAIVLDVKHGSGAFIPSVDEARALADAMREIGLRAGRVVETLLTSMDEPLADSVGDALELDEALSVMEGRGGSRALRDVALAVAAAMVKAAGAQQRDVRQALDDGRAFEKFRAMAAAQGGRLEAFDRSWPSGSVVRAAASGRIARIDARPIGEAVADAKRAARPDAVSRLGVRLHRRSGDLVREGEPLLTYWLGTGKTRLDDAVTIDPGRGAVA
jgi:pyrimidine-nucleoside phosphorylase